MWWSGLTTGEVRDGLGSTVRPRFPSWVRATSLGWLLGVPLVVVFALGGEVVGIGGVQVLVGLGMGAGVGLIQARVLKSSVERSWTWVLVTTGGLALPFLLTDLAAKFNWGLGYSLSGCVAMGGFLAGVGQARLLRTRLGESANWVLASVLGWSLGGAAAELGNTLVSAHALRGLQGAVVFLALSVLGGPVLGLVTGLALRPTAPRP